jgi:hypothetical protein
MFSLSLSLTPDKFYEEIGTFRGKTNSMKSTKVLQGFLGFSYGEILGTSLAAVVLLGPKDVPVIAKTLGRLSGKMVGYSHVYREKVERILDESGEEVKELREEMRGTTKALENVVGEIRGGFRRGGSLVGESRSRSRSEGSSNNSSNSNRSEMRGGSNTSSGEQPHRIFEGISAKAVGRDFAQSDAKTTKTASQAKGKTSSSGTDAASTVLLRALAEEEVAREALRLSEEGGLVDEKLNERV